MPGPAGPDAQNGCGNSACRAADFRARGFRTRGHPAAAARCPDCGQDRSASRRAQGFLPLAMPGFLRFFFTGGIAQIPARPLRRFPRACREGISFRAQGHFVSDFSREKIDQWSQCVAGHENLKRNETQKKRHAEVCKCGGSHPHASPPGRTRDFRTTGAAPGGSRHAVGKPLHLFPAFCCGLFRQPVDTDTNDTVRKFRSTPRKCPGFRAPVEPSPGNPVSHLKSESGFCGCSIDSIRNKGGYF